jgi:large subunit ribosomal protein L1
MTQDKTYTIQEAISEMKKEKKRKFDPAVEVHLNLNTDPKKQDQQIRFTTLLPHGTGKKVKVAVMASSKVANADVELSESDLAKIESGNLRPGRDFDVVVAEPRLMGKLAKVARILGPAGAMPNPKSGTVTDDIEKAVEQIKKGKIEIKTEQIHPIIHTVIGKLSFDDKKLEDNFNALISALKSNKPQKVKPDFVASVFVSSSMGRSYKIDLL